LLALASLYFGFWLVALSADSARSGAGKGDIHVFSAKDHRQTIMSETTSMSPFLPFCCSLHQHELHFALDDHAHVAETRGK